MTIPDPHRCRPPSLPLREMSQEFICGSQFAIMGLLGHHVASFLRTVGQVVATRGVYDHGALGVSLKLMGIRGANVAPAMLGMPLSSQFVASPFGLQSGYVVSEQLAFGRLPPKWRHHWFSFRKRSLLDIFSQAMCGFILLDTGDLPVFAEKETQHILHDF